VTATLSRAAADRPAPAVAAVHLGLGGFFRAHQAAYTELAPDSDAWGYAAFTGRRPDLARRLSAQDGLYTLLQRGPRGTEAAVIGSVSSAVPGGDTRAFVDMLARASTRLVTLTVTEAAYRRDEAGGVSLDDEDVAADLSALRRRDLAAVSTVPGRLVAGLAARWQAGGDPIAVVPCDNLLHNGAAVRRVITGLAAEVDPGLLGWIADAVSFVDSEVDRITPRATDRDRDDARRLTGFTDDCPVATEPFSEWVIAGDFPAGRPAWEAAGAVFVDDVGPFEERKLWLLNGAHSLLAYAGSIRGHRTVAAALADPVCRGWVEQWWDVAVRHVALPADELARYRAALVERFANPGIEHLLAQIVSDGSQKLPVRVLPVLAAERKAGRLPDAATRPLAGWVAHLRGHGAPVVDPLAQRLQECAARPDGVRLVLEALDPALPDDEDVVAAVSRQMEELVG
jgi:fructuronate reductase